MSENAVKEENHPKKENNNTRDSITLDEVSQILDAKPIWKTIARQKTLSSQIN